MEELKIYKFQAEEIRNTLSSMARILKCDKKITSIDRDVMQSFETINNVLLGNIDEHVPRY